MCEKRASGRRFNNMETRLRTYFLFVVILNCYTGVAEGGDDSLTQEDFIKVFGNEDIITTESYPENEQNYNECTYSNGKDPNIHKNIENMIKVLSRDSLPPPLEGAADRDSAAVRDIRDAANRVIVQLALHAATITRQIIARSIQTLEQEDAGEAVLRHCAMIEDQNRIKEVQQLADKISLLSYNTKELTDTISSNNKRQIESIEIINNKINVLENLTNSENHDIRDVLTITEDIQKSVKKTCGLEIMNQVVIEEKVANVSSLCDVKVPSSIISKKNSWKKHKVPKKDDLDAYMIKKTGCSYGAVPYDKNFPLEPATFDGDLLEWKFAVRSDQEADVGLTWDGWNHHGFTFFVGIKNNTKSSLREWKPWLTWEHPTPGLLSPERYVPVYLKMYNGTVSVGHQCESEPFITKPFAPNKGQKFSRLFKSWSEFGAKFLYNCPPNFPGCRYEAVARDQDHWLPEVVYGGGGALEWRLAVRTRTEADMALWWDHKHGFSFFVGNNSNTMSSLRKWETWQSWELPSAGLLSQERYVPVYFRIRDGTLVVGHECAAEPFFSQPFAANEGQRLQRLVKSWSPYGAKYLYDCPPSFPGQ